MDNERMIMMVAIVAIVGIVGLLSSGTSWQRTMSGAVVEPTSGAPQQEPVLPPPRLEPLPAAAMSQCGDGICEMVLETYDSRNYCEKDCPPI